MTSYDTLLKFKLTETEVSGFCPKCCTILPLSSITCGVEVNLSESAESDQLEVLLGRSLPYNSAEDFNDLYMGLKCPKCGKPMAFVDSGIANILAGFNRLKLFTIYSCEGHYLEDVEPNTGIPMFHENSCPYVFFIGNGRLICDILYWNLKKRGYTFEKTPNGKMIYVAVPDDDPDTLVQALKSIEIDIDLNTIYARMPSSSATQHQAGKEAFFQAMQALIAVLPDWIRDWYDNCTDDDIITNTEKEKAEYRRIWETDEGPEAAIIEHEKGGCDDECECCEH